MGDPCRFEALARFLRCTSSPATAATVVARGYGDLACRLGELGRRPVVVDSRPATLPRWLRRTRPERAARPAGTPSGVRA